MSDVTGVRNCGCSHFQLFGFATYKLREWVCTMGEMSLSMFHSDANIKKHASSQLDGVREFRSRLPEMEIPEIIVCEVFRCSVQLKGGGL